MRGEKAERVKRAGARAPELEREPRTAGKVLIVEDERATRAALEALLRRRYEVVSAPDASSLFELLDSYDPDLVLMDAGLPGRDGYRACAELRASRHRAVPVVFVTARQDDESYARFLRAGGDAYLRKPVEPAKLLAAIDRLIGKAPFG